MRNMVNPTLSSQKDIFRKSLLTVLSLVLAGSVWADTFTLDVQTQSTTHATFPINALLPQYQYSSNSSVAGWNLLQVGNGESFVVTNKTGATITAIKIEGVADNNSNKSTKVDVSDGTTTLSTGSSSWSNRKSSSMTSKNISNVNKLKMAAGTQYTFTNSGYNVGLRVTFTYTGGTPQVSTDATLSGLSYNGTAVPGFAADLTDYNVVLPAGTSTVPTVAATANDAAATVAITQAAALPGTATIVVTAEDGTTSKTYTISFSVESGAPQVLTCTWANIAGSAVIDQTNKSITGKVLNGNSLTLTPQFTGKYIHSWTPTGARDFSNGPVSYTFTSSVSSETTTYAVSISEAPAASGDATLSSLSVEGYSIAFSPLTYVYNVKLKAGTTTVPAVTSTVNDPDATAVKTDAAAVPGTTTIVVTAANLTTQTYTINFTVALPSTGLTIHMPEVYEASNLAGGYNGHLTIYQGREYEVYYASRDDSSKVSIPVIPGDKISGIENSNTNTATYAKARDGWVDVTVASISGGSSAKANAAEEFAQLFDEWRIGATSLKLHIKGYDRFDYYAADKSTELKDGAFKKEQRFQVFIDGIMQPETQCNTNATVRHYDISTGEHVIEVKGMSGGESKLYGFALRLSQEPRTRRLKGNDSTQVILQTTAAKAVYYFTKYNSKGETRLLWDGAEATGISLQLAGSGELGDTLMLSGTANCPVGTYHYRVESYYNNVATTSLPGSFSVTSQIKAQNDTDIIAYTNLDMEQLRFRYYALAPEDVTLTWTNTAPAGITGSAVGGIYTLSGTPTAVGIYPYTLSVTGGNTVHGTITVREFVPGSNPVLYLYKNGSAYDKDGVFTYLTANGQNLISLKTNENGPRQTSLYNIFRWVLISEDVDADNPEVLAILRNGINLPVLNMKSFTYAPGRITELGWGEPDNGSLEDGNGCKIYVNREDHPIFGAMNKRHGDAIQVLDSITRKGLMPIKITHCDNSLCLATAYTRDMDDYYQSGYLETFLHEIPASQRPDGKKYICLPIASSSTVNLTADGKQLLNSVIAYLLDNQSTVALPQLEITSFSIDGVAGTIDQTNNRITLSINEDEHPSLDLRAAVPTVLVKDSKLTHAEPVSGEAVDFSRSIFKPVKYEVTDYINRRVYDVVVSTYSPQGIDQVYTTGEWVTIYDIHGRKISTTNENIYTMALPQGVYLIINERGETFKLLK